MGDVVITPADCVQESDPDGSPPLPSSDPSSPAPSSLPTAPSSPASLVAPLPTPFCSGTLAPPSSLPPKRPYSIACSSPLAEKLDPSTAPSSSMAEFRSNYESSNGNGDRGNDFMPTTCGGTQRDVKYNRTPDEPGALLLDPLLHAARPQHQLSADIRSKEEPISAEDEILLQPVTGDDIKAADGAGNPPDDLNLDIQKQKDGAAGKPGPRSTNASTDDKKFIHSSHDALQKAVTALYANLLVILGFSLPLAEVMSVHIEEGYYKLFYVYLYLGSLIFLIFIYIDKLHSKTRRAVVQLRNRKNIFNFKDGSDSGRGSKEASDQNSASTELELLQRESESAEHTTYGSFYLRLGTVLFGIGSLIYTGIEIGGIFEIGLQNGMARCGDFTSIVRPSLQVIFIFTQMYFIFLNQKMNVYKHKLVGRFGLMHMIATNLCVWLKVLIMETMHSIDLAAVRNKAVALGLTNGSMTLRYAQLMKLNLTVAAARGEQEGGAGGQHEGAGGGHHQEAPHGLHGLHGEDPACSNKIMYKLLEDSSPFLFPCTIEFSLICSAILFIMWKNVSPEHKHYKQHKMRKVLRENTTETENLIHNPNRRQQQTYSVDCSQSNTGLFCGIVVVVVTIISLIIFFVFISHQDPHTRHIAVQVASVSELGLYSVTTLAVLLGLCQMRRLWYDVTRKLELDNLLLVIAQTGVLIYGTFSIIGTFFQLEDHLTAFLASLATLVQTTLQTVFILDASCRFAYTSLQVKNKPGREVVTFLLVCNLAMWLLNTLETNRADSHPIQVEFYGGDWAWPIITHISMPLAIFYRFHSTVCLFEIWKKSFKYKPTNINYV